MKLENIINKIYIGFLGFFEFIVDILITILTVYILNITFEKSLVITILTYVISISGITYGINDIIEKYRNNKDGN